MGMNSALSVKLSEDKKRKETEKREKIESEVLSSSKAIKRQVELLEKQLAEVTEQNVRLKENYYLLNKLYESTKKEAKASKIFGWISFTTGTLIGIAGIIFGFLY